MEITSLIDHTMIRCYKCNLNKNSSEFTKSSKTKIGFNTQCKKCYKEYTQNVYLKRPEVIERKKNYYLANKEKAKKYRELHYIPHPRVLLTDEEKKIRKRLSENKYRNRKRKEDSSFKLINILRNRLNRALEIDQKSGSAIQDLGCSIEEFKVYLEGLFEEGMNWDNYGKGYGTWQIDHIIPLCSVDLTNREEFLKVAHFSNMKPMWYEQHKIKSMADKKLSKKRT